MEDKDLTTATAEPSGMPRVDESTLTIPLEEWQALKARYGKLYIVDIEIDEDEKYQFFVRRPTRALIESTTANHKDLIKVQDLMVKNLIVAGDMAAIEDGIVYSALISKLGTIVGVAKGFLSKA